MNPFKKRVLVVYEDPIRNVPGEVRSLILSALDFKSQIMFARTTKSRAAKIHLISLKKLTCMLEDFAKRNNRSTFQNCERLNQTVSLSKSFLALFQNKQDHPILKWKEFWEFIEHLLFCKPRIKDLLISCAMLPLDPHQQRYFTEFLDIHDGLTAIESTLFPFLLALCHSHHSVLKLVMSTHYAHMTSSDKI